MNKNKVTQRKLISIISIPMLWMMSSDVIADSTVDQLPAEKPFKTMNTVNSIAIPTNIAANKQTRHPRRLAPTRSSVKQTRIPVSLLNVIIKAQFNGVKIRLNNYGAKRGSSWYKGGDSYIRLPAALGGKKHTFKIGAINKSPFRYYINDINATGLNVKTSGNRFHLTLNFESNGTEIKGRCGSKNKFKNAICRVRGSDAAAPDIQMNNSVAHVYLTPAVRNNSISFGKVSTNFTANIQLGGTCKLLNKLVGGLCNKVVGYKGMIKREINKNMYASLNKNYIRNNIANGLRRELSKRGIKKIVSAKIVGRDMVVRYRTQPVVAR